MPASFDLTPVEFATPVGELAPQVMVEYLPADAKGSKVAIFSRGPVTSAGTLDLRVTHEGKMDPVIVRGLHSGSELGDVALQVLRRKPVRAFALPDGKPGSDISHKGVLTRVWLGLLTFVIVTIAILLASIDPGTLPVILLLALGCGVAWTLLPGSVKSLHHRFTTDRGAIPFAALKRSLPALSMADSSHRVDRVKQEYGRLLSSIEYRITNSALFDPAVDATREFTTALIQWEDAALLSSAERAELAARVEVTFDVARANAETLGLDHLPATARADAGRAVKAARVAADAPRDGERAAALRAVASILSGLALYYLPNPTEAIELVQGREVRELPGRRARGQASS